MCIVDYAKKRRAPRVQMSTVGFGDITPVGPGEEVAITFIIIAGVLFYGFLLGSITELLGNASKVGGNGGYNEAIS